MPYTDTMRERWFGPECAAPVAAQETALRTLDDVIRRVYATPLYISPGLTGALAWRKSRMGRDWEALPIAAQQLIRETSMQGRFECCPVVDPLPSLYCLDLRLAYAAAAEALCSGREWRHETRPAGGWTDLGEHPGWLAGFRGYKPARYRVLFQSPDDWQHVSLLPQRLGGNWEWALHGETWADACEVRLALECGWRIEILERLVCTDDTERQPLRGWVERLLVTRDNLAQGSSQPELYRAAIRAMILQAIGTFAARPKTELRTVGTLEELPAHDLAEQTFIEREDGTIEFEDYARNAGLSSLLHPEFASAIWAQTRVWLLRRFYRPRREPVADPVEECMAGALTMPREQIVGFGLDAIYTTANPEWPDDGREGRYRVKGSLRGPIPAPVNRRDLELIVKKMSDGREA